MNKYLAGVILTIFVLGSGALWLFGPTINQFFLQREAAGDINKKIQDADYAIDNYEWFKQQKAKIDQKKAQIKNVRDELDRFYEVNGRNSSEWSYSQKQSFQRINSRLTGQQQMYQKLVADYNARASMQTRNVFEDKLPYEMESKFWTGDLR